MKYAVRSLKYFIMITLIFSVVIWAMACYTARQFIYSPEELVAMLKNGWNSVYLILGVFALFSAIYPMMGYVKTSIAVGGSVSELKGSIDAFMEDRGYVFEKQTEDSLCYRINGSLSRLARSYEDRITITQGAGGLQLEGLRKDVVRIALSLETRLGSRE